MTSLIVRLRVGPMFPSEPLRVTILCCEVVHQCEGHIRGRLEEDWEDVPIVPSLAITWRRLCGGTVEVACEGIRSSNY